MIHAVMAIHLNADQVISGLAITLFGAGISSFFGRPFIGQTGLRIPALDAVTGSGGPGARSRPVTRMERTDP